MKKEMLSVLYSASDIYAPMAGISIFSLLENNKTFSKIVIYLISNGITDDNLKKMCEMVSKFNQEIYIIDSKLIDEKLERIGVQKFKESYATFQKIYIDQFVPNNDDYLLYIDSDTVIVDDLGGIFNDEKEHFYPFSIVRVPMFNKYNKKMGITCENMYPNCGIILFDRRKWTENCCEEKITSFLQKNSKKKLRAADQDIISLVFNDKMDLLPPEYNVGPGWVFHGAVDFMKIHEANEENFYSREKVENAIEHPKILHCLGGFYGRPWEIGNNHPFTSYWNAYREQTVWKNMQLMNMKKSKLMELQEQLHKVLPKTLYLKLHKIVMKMDCLKYFNN